MANPVHQQMVMDSHTLEKAPRLHPYEVNDLTHRIWCRKGASVYVYVREREKERGGGGERVRGRERAQRIFCSCTTIFHDCMR